MFSRSRSRTRIASSDEAEDEAEGRCAEGWIDVKKRGRKKIRTGEDREHRKLSASGSHKPSQEGEKQEENAKARSLVQEGGMQARGGRDCHARPRTRVSPSGAKHGGCAALHIGGSLGVPGVVPAGTSSRDVRLWQADGSRVKHLGPKTVRIRLSGGAKMRVRFDVREVSKPLAVSAMVKQGCGVWLHRDGAFFLGDGSGL